MDELLKRGLRGDSGMSRGPCLEPEQLAAWADGGLGADEARAVELHLSNCARCQAMAAAFATSDIEAAGVSGNVVPITARRSIRWALPMAVGTIAASLLVWVATRDGAAPDTQIATSRTATESRSLPASPESAARPQLSELKDERPDAKQLGAARSAQAGRGQQKKETRADAGRPSQPAEMSKTARAEPLLPAPAAAPKPSPAPTGFSTKGGVAGGVVGGLAQPVSPPPAAMPPPPPAPVTSARQTTISGLPQATINITLDGVSMSDPMRSSETFFAMNLLAEFASPLSARLDALEAVSVKQTNATDAVFRAGAGGGGRGGGGRGGAGAGAGVASAVPVGARGAIEGSIQDPGGGVVPGVVVQARALGSAVTSTATTDNLGNYRFTGLAPGTYTVTANLQGFVTKAVDDVVVETGKTTRANVTLTLAALTETVTVQSASKTPREQMGATRWRIFSNNVVHRSGDGVNWTTVRLDAGLPEVTTGVAPAPAICWLVGRAGLVLVMSNGTTFRRVATPANVDLRSVQATDALNATVTAADGRKFTTADGGLSWK
jgi:Carboxypeptidase regulatory-like domain/Putative zinc-finger